MLAASDVFVLCSLREGMSNALLEAMQAGCVPVVTPVGDNARIVEDGVSGCVAGPDQLTRAIVSLSDRTRREPMRHRAIARARCYSVEAMAEATEAVYRRCLAGEDWDGRTAAAWR